MVTLSEMIDRFLSGDINEQVLRDYVYYEAPIADIFDALCENIGDLKHAQEKGRVLKPPTPESRSPTFELTSLKKRQVQGVVDRIADLYSKDWDLSREQGRDLGETNDSTRLYTVKGALQVLFAKLNEIGIVDMPIDFEWREERS